METQSSKSKIQNNINSPYPFYSPLPLGEGIGVRAILTFLSFIIFAIIFAVGCARTVTPIVTFGEEMSIEITLRGTVEVTSNRYFLILSSIPNYSIPLPPPNVNNDTPEFIEPGTTPQLGTAEAYYNNYFSTWAGYIKLDNGAYYLVSGPFTLGQNATQENIAFLSQASNKLTFHFPLAKIFGNNLPNTIYFDCATVAWSAGHPKIPADHINASNMYVSKISGSVNEVEDVEDDSLAASLDIRKCRVEIQ